MTKLTKAERDELRRLDDQDRAVWTHDRGSVESQDPRALPDETSGFCYYMGSGAPLAAAARNALPRLLADLDAAEAERDRAVSERSEAIVQMQREWTALTDQFDGLRAQRDRAESDLDAERKMRVEAEAASDRMVAERDALKAQRDGLHARLYPQPCKGCPGCSSYADCPDEIDRLTTERDALKAKLADPRRVVIHETEVVATKDEIASLKARLADLSEADEELHTCRALVNATSENLSVDLERMVDDLADANEKAARSEKDSHSWYELYKDAKAKLAALANAAEVVAENYEDFAGFGELDCLAPLHAAIAAARGGAS